MGNSQSSSQTASSTVLAAQPVASTSQDTTDYIKNATFSTGSGPVLDPTDAVTASDLFQGAMDPTKLHPLAQLGDKLDYLLLDDDKTSEIPGADTAIPSRGWSDDLCYGTGTMYLSGELFYSFQISIFARTLSLLGFILS